MSTQEVSSTSIGDEGGSVSCRVRRIGLAPKSARPDLLRLHEHDPGRYPHFLESAATGTSQARYDILFAFPGKTLELSSAGLLCGPDKKSVHDESDFLNAFDAWWEKESLPRRDAENPEAPPFTGGWFVFLGYELAGQIEPTLNLPSPPDGLPVAFATRFPAALVLDHGANQIFLVAEEGEEKHLDQMAADFEKIFGSGGSGDGADIDAGLTAGKKRGSEVSGFLDGDLMEDPEHWYLDGVRKCIEYVFDGDVFQVNLSRAWQGKLNANLTHGEIYDRLRHANPAPFAGMATLGDMAIISSSPERLVEVRGNVIQTRPIAGTRPRGSSGITDVALSEELLAHPKERAEHIMLVDLERNDLSRVATPGSVRVNEMMVVESYAHVHHIVSNVCGELKDSIRPGEVIRAVFPGGTITGCPKVRCMEIIAELERAGRGAYTGSMGFVNRDGSLDLNILIRTMVREGNKVSLRAGAGIVADSVPEKELDETRAKARGLVRALL